MECGEIKVHPIESVLVRQIYNLAISNTSLQSIANYCNTQNIPYNEDKPQWTKHMVRRVLENTKYYENEQYPLLVSQADFEKAYALRTQKVDKMDEGAKLLRKHLFCAQCESKMTLVKQKNATYKAVCKTCGQESLAMAIAEWQAELHYRLSKLYENPNLIKVPQNSALVFPTAVVKAEQALSEMLETDSVDEQDVLSAIFARAQAEYSHCSVNEYCPLTLQIKEVLQEEKPQEFNQDIFLKLVSKVLLYQGNIALKLINYQII